MNKEFPPTSRRPLKLARPSKLDLSFKEKEIICLICDGMTSPEISADLGIPRRTLEGIRKRLMKKLDLATLAQLGVWAVKNGVY